MTREAGGPPPDALVLPWNVVVSVRDLEALRAGASEAGVRRRFATGPRAAPSATCSRVSSRTPRGSCRGTSSERSRWPSAGVLAGTSVSPNAMTLVSVGDRPRRRRSSSCSRPPRARRSERSCSSSTRSSTAATASSRASSSRSRAGAACSTSGATTSCTSAVFAAMAVGWSRAGSGRPWPLAAGGGGGRRDVRVGVLRVPADDDEDQGRAALHVRGDRGRNAPLPRRRRRVAAGFHLPRSDTVRLRQGPLVPRSRGRRRTDVLPRADGDRSGGAERYGSQGVVHERTGPRSIPSWQRRSRRRRGQAGRAAAGARRRVDDAHRRRAPDPQGPGQAVRLGDPDAEAAARQAHAAALHAREGARAARRISRTSSSAAGTSSRTTPTRRRSRPACCPPRCSRR